MNFNKLVDSILNEQTPSVGVNNIQTLAKTISDPNIDLLNVPVSYQTQAAQGNSMNYGNNVTLGSIIKNAQNKLQALGQNPQDKQNILTQTANQLQDYVVGLNQDKKVSDEYKIDDQTRDQFMNMASNLNNVEQFIGAIKLPQTNNTLTTPKPQPLPSIPTLTKAIPTPAPTSILAKP